MTPYRLLLACGLLGVLAASPRVALACRCGGARPARVLVPTDGATGFPTNGRVRVVLRAFPPAVRARLGEEYRLRDVDGKLVPLDARIEDTLLTLAPRALLRPRTRYTIERVQGYEDGALLDEEERLRLAYDGTRQLILGEPRPSRAVRVWFPESRFTTGEGPEPLRAETAEVAEAIVFANQTNCGPGPELYVRYGRPRLSPFDLVRLELRDHGVLRTFAPVRDVADLRALAARIGNDICQDDPMLLREWFPYEVRLVTLTASDQRVVPPSWVRATVDGQRPERPPREAIDAQGGFYPRTPDTDAAAAARYFAGLAREPTTRDEPPGPAACPFGLERIETRALAAPATAATDYSSWKPLGAVFRDGALEVVGGHGEIAEHVLHASPSGPLTVHALAAHGRHVSPTSDGWLVAGGLRGEEDGGLAVARVNARGQTQWSRRLAERAGWDDLRLAWSAKGALACWIARPRIQERSGGRFRCTALDGGTGRVAWSKSVAPRAARSQRDTSPAVMDVLALAGGYVVAWCPSEDLYECESAELLFLDDKGRTRRTLALGHVSTNAGLALTSAAGALLAVRDDTDAGIEGQWLDEGGGAGGGAPPIPVSAGSGSGSFLPQTIRLGALAAVAWYDRWVAAVDRTGAVSPALHAGDGVPSSEFVMAASDDRVFLVSEGDESGPRLEVLACRASRPPTPEVGAPQRILRGGVEVRPGGGELTDIALAADARGACPGIAMEENCKDDVVNGNTFLESTRRWASSGRGAGGDCGEVCPDRSATAR